MNRAATAATVGVLLGLAVWRWIVVKHRADGDRPMIRVGNGSLKISVDKGKLKEKRNRWWHKSTERDPNYFHVCASLAGDCNTATLTGTTVQITYGNGTDSRVLTFSIESNWDLLWPLNFKDPVATTVSEATHEPASNGKSVTIDRHSGYYLVSVVTLDASGQSTGRFDFPPVAIDRSQHTVCLYPHA